MSTCHSYSRGLKSTRLLLREWRGRAGRLLSEYRGVFLALFVLQLVCYSYLFTGLLFTNHTFPNVWIQNYPSFKTQAEGRWLADLLILAQGGSGVPSVMMVLAAGLQSLNGIMLARLLCLRSKVSIFLTAALLCLYPAFLDYYSFSIDHFTFVLGDSFALVGTLIFVRGHLAWARLLGTAGMFVLALACYQPKIALVCFFATVGVLLRWTDDASDAWTRPVWRPALSELLLMTTALGTALLAYGATAMLSINAEAGARTHVNSLTQALEVLPSSYPKLLVGLTSGMGGIPSSLAFLPLTGVLFGASLLIGRATRRSPWLGLGGAALLVLVPIGVNAAMCINNQTWVNAGRIMAANGYVLVFFLCYGLRFDRCKYPAAGISGVCLYFFAVLATQQTNAVEMKTLYDVSMINRIAARAEAELGAGTSPPQGLVVRGRYPRFDRRPYVKHPPTTNHAHVFSDTFADYRQVEILNFMVGREAFRRPTPDEQEAAMRSTAERKAWPDREAVYRHGDSVVIILGPA